MTRAVLLNRSGPVHRIVTNARGEEITSCGEPCQRSAPVRPIQALVYHLEACNAGCWNHQGAWRSFVDGEVRT